MRIELEDGKYTYLLDEGAQKALRYGEPWRDLCGDKFIYSMACEIERLQAENAELQIFKQMWNDFVSLQHGDAQLLCKDAERYRWLRYAGYGFDIAVREEYDEGEQWVHGYPPEELDAAIDAAMKGGE